MLVIVLISHGRCSLIPSSETGFGAMHATPLLADLCILLSSFVITFPAGKKIRYRQWRQWLRRMQVFLPEIDRLTISYPPVNGSAVFRLPCYSNNERVLLLYISPTKGRNIRSLATEPCPWRPATSMNTVGFRGQTLYVQMLCREGWLSV